MAEYFSHPLLALVKERGLIDDLQMEEVVQEQTRGGKTVADRKAKLIDELKTVHS